MIKGSFYFNLFEKIKNREELGFRELQTVERLLNVAEYEEELLDIQIGVEDNKYNLEYVKECK